MGFLLWMTVALVVSVDAQSAGPASMVYGQQGSFTTKTENAPSQSVPETPSAIGLLAPGGMRVDSSGNLYACDEGNNRIVFYPSGTTTATRVYGWPTLTTTGNEALNPPTASSLSEPSDLIILSTGMFACDSGNSRVLFYAGNPPSTTATEVYGQGGNFTSNTEGTSATALSGPFGLALNPTTGMLFVADTGNNRIVGFPKGSTTATFVIGQPNFVSSTPGTSTTELSGPSGLVLDSAGNIYCADTINNRVVYFSAGATVATRVYGQGGSFNTSAFAVSQSGLTAPLAVALGTSVVGKVSETALLIVDGAANRVVAYVPATNNTNASIVFGQPSFTSSEEETSQTELMSPTSVTVGSTGTTVYVADTGNNRIMVWNHVSAASALGPLALLAVMMLFVTAL